MRDQITRRDFLDGVACAIALGGVPRLGLAADPAAPYPPARTGYGGSGPKDFAIAHGVRDGRRYDLGAQPAS
jgi:hypothetical protein